jgi:hypothetical protein
MPVALSEIGGGGKSWSPENLGEKIQGRIRLVERRPQRAFGSGEELTWDDGRPRLLTYIELETELHDDDDDDGVRALYAKGGRNFEPQQGSGASMEVAIAEAVKAAGASSIDEGGTLVVQFSGVAKPTTRGYQGAKLFKAQYKPPVSSVKADDLFDDDLS